MKKRVKSLAIYSPIPPRKMTFPKLWKFFPRFRKSYRPSFIRNIPLFTCNINILHGCRIIKFDATERFSIEKGHWPARIKIWHLPSPVTEFRSTIVLLFTGRELDRFWIFDYLTLFFRCFPRGEIEIVPLFRRYIQLKETGFLKLALAWTPTSSCT